MKLYKIRITTYKALLSISLTLLFSCDLFLDVAPPKTELATDLVFDNNSTANAAITSIYAQMATVNGTPLSNMVWLSGLSADEFTNYATDQRITAFYTNSLSPSDALVASYFWTPYYNIIYQTNAIIEGLSKSTGVSDIVKKQIIGEAKFIRAFYHFYLTGFYGDIPLVTSSDYRINATLSRSPQIDVYKQIVSDLLDAREMLNNNYVGADGTTTSTERVRPNEKVAAALLARVYLYTKNYEKAEDEATTVIDDSRYTLTSNLNNTFLKNSAEAIWQLQPFTGAATTFATKFVLITAPTTGLDKSIVLNSSILNLFDSNDLRYANWVGKITVSGQTHYFPNKYKVTGVNTTEYDMVIRLAELHLIRAEARIHQDDIKNGLADLNVLRKRANVEEYDVETITDDPFLLVERERQRELFSEGHRWFDLRRTGQIDEVMTIFAPSKGAQWRAGSALYPIPQTERNSNPNLSQNDY